MIRNYLICLFLNLYNDRFIDSSSSGFRFKWMIVKSLIDDNDNLDDDWNEMNRILLVWYFVVFDRSMTDVKLLSHVWILVKIYYNMIILIRTLKIIVRYSSSDGEIGTENTDEILKILWFLKLAKGKWDDIREYEVNDVHREILSR